MKMNKLKHSTPKHQKVFWLFQPEKIKTQNEQNFVKRSLIWDGQSLLPGDKKNSQNFDRFDFIKIKDSIFPLKYQRFSFYV